MIELIVLGMTVAFVCISDRRVRSRQWRKWLGIVMAASGAIATLNLPSTFYEINFWIVYMLAWLNGLFLFFDRDRFEEEN